jgi:hypothetical protein
MNGKVVILFNKSLKQGPILIVIFFFYPCFNYLGYAITDSNISYMGMDKGYIGRSVNKILELDFRASTIGHFEKTLNNYI